MVERFGRTERALHWVHATGFFAMLATGLVLYLPALSELVARRNLVKNVHIFSALAWAVAICLVVALGDRRRLAADWREIETLDRDDRRWLRGRRVAQGRFNAGQKLNAIVTAAFAVLFAVSAVILAGMWTERFVLIVTSQSQDFLPSSFRDYVPTPVDAAILAGSGGLFALLFLLFVRFVPVIAVHEIKHLRSELAPEAARG